MDGVTCSIQYLWVSCLLCTLVTLPLILTRVASISAQAELHNKFLLWHMPPVRGQETKHSANVQADALSAEAERMRIPLHDALAHSLTLHSAYSYLPSEEARTDIVAALLRAGASASSRDRRGETPLTHAIDGDRLAALSMLLAHETCPGPAELSHELRRMVQGSSGGAGEKTRQVLCSHSLPACCRAVRRVSNAVHVG